MSDRAAIVQRLAATRAARQPPKPPTWLQQATTYLLVAATLALVVSALAVLLKTHSYNAHMHPTGGSAAVPGGAGQGGADVRSAAGAGEKAKAAAVQDLPPVPVYKEFTAEQLARLRAAAAVVTPELVEKGPPATGFEPGIKNPCWKDASGGGGLKCLPGVYVTGVFHAGGGSLYDKLCQHPDIVRDAASQAQFWGEDGKTMEYFLQHLRGAAEAVAADPQRKLVIDGSLSTFAFYWSAGTKTHRGYTGNMVPCWKECNENQAANNMTTDQCMAARCFASSLAKDHEVAREAGIDFDDMHVPMVMRALYGARPPKVVAVVRHPVLRLHSAYWGYPHYHNKYGRTAEGFRQYVVEQVAAFRACVGRNHTARECALYFEALGMDEEKVYFHCDQLLRGMYSVWLEVWQRFLPPSSLLVVKAEDYFADPEATLRGVAEFLGLGPLQQDVLNKMLAAGQHKSYASGVGPMLPEAKQLLVDFYRPYNEHMARLTDDARYLEWNTVPDPVTVTVQPAAGAAAAGAAAGAAEQRRLQRRLKQ